MADDRDVKIARSLKDRICTLTPVRRIVIFGSRSRRSASPESDLDVFIELSEVTPQLRQHIREIAWEISFENEIVISTFIATSESVERGLLSANPILKAIEAEGIAV